MPVNPVAENVFGTIGTILWCIQLVPQAWKSYREKSTVGLSAGLMLMWALAAFFLGVYNIADFVNIPLIVQPQLFGTLAATCWVQCLYYQGHLSKWRAIATFVTFEVLFGGLEAAFVFAVRHGLDKNNQRPLQFFGVMTAILLFAGLFPQYYEIWKLGEVQGVSMAFMTIDFLGGFFSVLSLAFKPSVDPLLAFSYSGVVVLDGIVILLKLILNPLANRRRKRAARAQAEAEAGGAPGIQMTEQQEGPSLTTPESGQPEKLSNEPPQRANPLTSRPPDLADSETASSRTAAETRRIEDQV